MRQRFGNGEGGDISYVAPCDADDGMNTNTVTVWVDALCTGAVTDAAGTPELLGGAPNAICEEMSDYINPCGTDGCSLTVTCEENADTPVSFNFTVMGQANQGFFDLAVNFDDVFCSAKLDTCNTDGTKIDLMFAPDYLPLDCPWGSGVAYGGLTAEANTRDFSAGPNPDGCDAFGQPHYMQAPSDNPFAPPSTPEPNPDAGQRIDTIVAAVACTAGPGADVSTHLTMTNLMVGCINPTAEGPHELEFSPIVVEGNTTIGPWPAAVYYGTEALPDVNKVFTTVAIGIGDASSCYLQWQVIPSDGALPSDWSVGDSYESFGYVNFEANGLGGNTCFENPLNGVGSAVTSAYHPKTPIQSYRFPARLVEGDTTFDNYP